MARTPLVPVLHYLRTRLGFAAAEGDTDAQLLRRFADGHDEVAFEALLLRHGPLVWGVCRRVLAREQDAEDAFQATFLVLVRKAASVRKQSSLASWLYGVAHRIALKARADAQRRCSHELGDVAAPQADGPSEASAREVQAILEEEILQLPERLRVPVVLCCLEGRSKAEAARQLGWKEGTVASRLARARQRLRGRLARRGVLLPGGSLGLLVAEQTAAAVPAATATAALRLAVLCASGEAASDGTVSTPVLALAKGAIQAMTVTKLKMGLTLAVVMCTLAAGAGWAAHQIMTVKGPEAKRQDGPTLVAAKGDAPQPDADRQVRTDYYGDPLPPGVLARLGTVRFRHPHAHLVFAADGKTLVSAGKDGAVCFWDAATGKQVYRRLLRSPQLGSLEEVLLTPDGKTLAAWDSEVPSRIQPALFLYDTATGKELQRIPDVRASRSHRPAFSRDGKILVTATDLGGRVAIRLWDVATGKERLALKTEHDIRGFALSPDGRLLASVGGDEVLRLGDTTTGRELRTMPLEGQKRLLLAFSPDGKTLAVADRHGTVTLCEAATLKKQGTLKPSVANGWICSLAYSPDGGLLAVGGYSELVLWDIAAQKERRLPEKAVIGWETLGLAFAPDGKTLACAVRMELHLWDVTTGERLHHLPGYDNAVLSVAVSPDGKVVASVGEGDPTLRLWDAATGQPLPPCPKHNDYLRCCDFSADGRWLVSGSGEGEGTLRLWAAATGEEVRRFAIKELTDVCHLSPDGKRLAAVSTSRDEQNHLRSQITVWNARTGDLLARRPFRGGQHSCFTPDGEGVTVDGTEGLTIEETMTGRVRGTIRGDLGNPVFSPDGKLVAVDIRKTNSGGPFPGSWQSLGVRVAEVATGQEVFHLEGWIPFVAFSRDGRVLATADAKALCLWDAVTGEPLFRRPWPEGLAPGSLRTPIGYLALLPGDRAAVTGMADGTALVWDLAPEKWPAPKIAPDPGRKELDALWADLGDDARKAHRAIRTLAAVHARAVPFLKDHLRPVPAADPQRVQRLLAELDSDQFAARQSAAAELTKLGERIEPALRQALEGQPSLEMRQRVTAILEALRTAPSVAVLRSLRAIQALEQSGTAEARQVLQSLGTGARAARETREARAALERLARRPASSP